MFWLVNKDTNYPDRGRERVGNGISAVKFSGRGAGDSRRRWSHLGSYIALHSSNRWQLHFNASKQLNKLIVIDFAATWYGPCKFMESAIHAMATKYTDVDFVKIDVDELSDVAGEFGVRAMPTFVLLKQGKEVERVMGAKKDELETKILKYGQAPKFAA